MCLKSELQQQKPPSRASYVEFIGVFNIHFLSVHETQQALSCPTECEIRCCVQNHILRISVFYFRQTTNITNVSCSCVGNLMCRDSRLAREQVLDRHKQIIPRCKHENLSHSADEILSRVSFVLWADSDEIGYGYGSRRRNRQTEASSPTKHKNSSRTHSRCRQNPNWVRDQAHVRFAKMMCEAFLQRAIYAATNASRIQWPPNLTRRKKWRDENL